MLGHYEQGVILSFNQISLFKKIKIKIKTILDLERHFTFLSKILNDPFQTKKA